MIEHGSDLDAVIVGAGFNGLDQLHRLREQGQLLNYPSTDAYLDHIAASASSGCDGFTLT